MNELNNKELFREKVNIAKLQAVAQKLKSGEIEIDDLSDEKIDEMILFFSECLRQKDEELKKIKSRILKINKDIK